MRVCIRLLYKKVKRYEMQDAWGSKCVVKAVAVFFFKLFCLPNHSRLASLQLYEGLVVPVLRRQVLFSSTPIRLQPLSFFFFSDFVLLLTLFISFFPASSSCVLCSTHSSHFISSHIYAAASCVLFIYGLERGHLLLTKRFFLARSCLLSSFLGLAEEHKKRGKVVDLEIGVSIHYLRFLFLFSYVLLRSVRSCFTSHVSRNGFICVSFHYWPHAKLALHLFPPFL